MEDVNPGLRIHFVQNQDRRFGCGTTLLQRSSQYARVYVDGYLAGVVDRRLGQKSLGLTVTGGQRLDILVENSGRINFKPVIRGERAGILGQVSFHGTTLNDWNIYPLPLAPPTSKRLWEEGLHRALFLPRRVPPIRNPEKPS